MVRPELTRASPLMRSFHLEHIVGLVVEPPVQLYSSLNPEQSSKQPSFCPASHTSFPTTKPSLHFSIQFSGLHSQPFTILQLMHP